MTELGHSKIKTQHSIIDWVSVNDAIPPSDHHQQVEELEQLYQWLNLRNKNKTIDTPSHQPSKQFSFFMLKLESLQHLPYRRVQKDSKVYAIIRTSIVQLHRGCSIKKIVTSFKQLEESSSLLFDLKESIYYYCYSGRQAQMQVRIEVSLCQQFISANTQEETKPIYLSPETIGVIVIPLSKEVKNKEKKGLIALQQLYTDQNGVSSEAKGAYCHFALVKSQAYRHLQKLIPSDTICDCHDRIPGVMGGTLPVNQNALSDFSVTPQAQGLMLQFNHIQVSSALFKQAHNRCQLYVQHMFAKVSKVGCSLKQIVLKVCFHNGWKVVSAGNSVLKEKQNKILPTHQSIADHRHRTKENVSVKDQLASNKNREVKYFQTDNNIELGLTFPGEEQCVLIIQLYSHFIVTGQMAVTKDGKATVEAFKEVIQIPVGFALLSGKGMTIHRVQTLKINAGCPITSQQNLWQMLAHQLASIQKGQTTLNKTGRPKKSAIMNDADDISIMKSVRTVSNLTNVSLKRESWDLGTVQFQMHGRQKQFIPLTDNTSLNLQNFSSYNFSKVDLKDKINAEKQRILKETKRNIQVNKKIGIQFFNRPSFSVQQKLEVLVPIYKDSVNKLAKQKQSLLTFLQQYMPRMPFKDTIKGERSGRDIKSENLPVYYSLKATLSKSNVVYEPLKLSPLFYKLLSNRQFANSSNLNLYEPTPIQIIRTELSELNYNNCYFFNFQTVVASINENMSKFPKVFLFKTRFWNQPEIRSELMSINKDTGQITLFRSDENQPQEKDLHSKIMHLQVGFDQNNDSYQLDFIHFIEYLYNGLLVMEMKDYSTGFTFGTFSLPLRNLIRKRRNQVTLLHEDYIYHKHQIRGKFKLQVRAIRKMKPKIRVLHSITHQTPLNQSAISPQNNQAPNEKESKQKAENDRILQRIQKFKESKTRRFSPTKGRFDVKLGEQGEEEQCRHIENMFVQKFVSQRKTIKVSSLKKYFFFVSIRNKNEHGATYRLCVNDEDEGWISKNPLSSGQEIAVVKDFNLLDRRDKQKLLSIKKFIEKIDKCHPVREDGSIHLQAKAKGTLMLCYFSVRKYKEWTDGQIQDSLTIYNRQRNATCSLINSQTGTIQSLFSIQVIPVPDQSNLQLQFYRPYNEKTVLHLPFLDTDNIDRNMDQVLVDHPFALLSSASSLPQKDKKMQITSEKGTFLQFTTGIAFQKSKEVNVLFINNIEQKQRIRNAQRKTDRSRLRYQQSRVQLVENYYSGPPMINMSLTIHGCQKIAIKAELWIQFEFQQQLQNRHLSDLLSTNYVYIFSQNTQVVKICKNPKLKLESPDIFKINQANLFTNFYLKVTGAKVGYNFVNINVVEGKEVVEQDEALLKGQFKQITPIYRMVVCLQTRVPSFKETLKINVNRSTQQKIIEEPFSYKSSCPKKTDFKVFSSDSSMVWVKGGDSSFQLQGRGQKKLAMLFNLQNVIQTYESGSSQIAILGFKWDRGIDYYALRFNIY